MLPPAFLDTNIPIYAAGREHPLKEPCLRILRLVAQHPESFVTDVEVLQELIHRYLTLRQWDLGRGVFSRFAGLMEGRIEPILALDVAAAAGLADQHAAVSGRDLLHAAVLRRLGDDRIVTADRDFERLGALERLDPATLNAWEASITGAGGG